MTTDQIIAAIKRRLSRRNDPTIEALILDEIITSQNILEEKATIPDFLLTSYTPVTLPDDDEIDLTVELGSATYIRLYKDMPVAILDTEADPVTGEVYQKLERFDAYEKLVERHPGTATVPLAYVEQGRKIILRPKPTIAQEYRIRFYQKDPTTPAVGNSTLWTTNEGHLLMAHAGQEISQYLRDEDAGKYFKEKLREAYAIMYKRQVAAEMADMQSSRGDD